LGTNFPFHLAERKATQNRVRNLLFYSDEPFYNSIWIEIILKTAVKNSLVRHCKLKQEYSAANPLTRNFREAEANWLFLFYIRTFCSLVQRQYWGSAQGVFR
jgi:hypothetical protein